MTSVAPLKKQFKFPTNSNFQSFQTFTLKHSPQHLLNAIDHPHDISKKIKALALGCLKRNEKILYKGEKYYQQDLQLILDNFAGTAPSVFKSLNITLDKSQTKVLIQCQNCATFTQINKFCPNCEHVHYCHEGCEMKLKFTHERQQCKVRPFPRIYKPLQVEVFVGSDLGQNVSVFFQHEVSMSLLLRGEQLLEEIMTFFRITPEGKGISTEYQIKNENKMLKFQKQLVSPLQKKDGKDELNFESIEDISKIYKDNRILRGLELHLLENGGILWKNVRQIHDNHLREVFIFHLP